ncbi:LGFP repeat-containing protein [Saccharothrix deserti]|uniref:LGFP repeat-containing protein n=1 Tax=Saccharothrix deserti TaxID=2593674 RepID=UPI00131C68F0|nr:hypothetical protein [Saccharothrix deserti]
MTAIDDKRRELPWLGAPVDTGAGSAEMAMPDGRGRARDFENGTIYWTPEHGAHEVHGAIRVKWAQLGGHSGLLRYPVTDELPCGPGEGRFNHFEGGSIYWRADIGPHEVHGPIRDKWAQMGWQDGRLGYPRSDVRGTHDRAGCTFQHGTITWTPTGGAVVAWNID